MSDIFISYAREDRETAQRLAAALEAEGWSVWWDTRLRAGEIWDEVIVRELAAARCVIVLWSRVSVERNWVRVEAREGLRRRALVPVRIENVEPPIEFGRVHVGDLIDWNGHETHPGFRQVVADIADLLGLAAPQPAPSPAEKPQPDDGVTRGKTDGSPKDAWHEWLGRAVATIKHYGARTAGWRLRKHHLAMAGGAALLVFIVAAIYLYEPPQLSPEPPLRRSFETDTQGIIAEVIDFSMAGEWARLSIRFLADWDAPSSLPNPLHARGLCVDLKKARLVDERTGQEWKASGFSHGIDCHSYHGRERRTYWMSFQIGQDPQTTFTALVPGLAEPVKGLELH